MFEHQACGSLESGFCSLGMDLTSWSQVMPEAVFLVACDPSMNEL